MFAFIFCLFLFNFYVFNAFVNVSLLVCVCLFGWQYVHTAFSDWTPSDTAMNTTASMDYSESPDYNYTSVTVSIFMEFYFADTADTLKLCEEKNSLNILIFMQNYHIFMLLNL